MHEEKQDNLDKRLEPDNLKKEFESPAAQIYTLPQIGSILFIAFC
jgi:hypothetical protein